MTSHATRRWDMPHEDGPTPRLVSGRTSSAEIERLVTEQLRLGRPRRLRFLLSRLRSSEDAEDVLQDFSLKAIQGAGRLTEAAKVDAWLGVTLRNALFDRYRRNAGRRRLQEAATAEPRATPEMDHDLETALICLTQATERLKPEARELVRRAELQQIPLKAIAADLGLTANNVGVRVYRAREALRREMRASCGACDHPCDLAARFLQVA
jgi:RNA polymerase sigma factor (sigma-70 family)